MSKKKKSEEKRKSAAAAPPAPAAPPAARVVKQKNGLPLIGRTYRAILPLLFVLSMFAGCAEMKEALNSVASNAQVCVEYKGRRICVGRENGKWTIYANVTPEEEKEILGVLER